MTGCERQRGITLLENMITIVIVMIGLLGMVSLQSAALVSSEVSATRAKAGDGARRIADRIRANHASAADAVYDETARPSRRIDPPADCRSRDCSPAEMAGYDTWQWDRMLSRSLPEGRGFIDCEQWAGDDCLRYRVAVVWRELGNGTDQCVLEAHTDRCYLLRVVP